MISVIENTLSRNRKNSPHFLAPGPAAPSLRLYPLFVHSALSSSLLYINLCMYPLLCPFFPSFTKIHIFQTITVTPLVQPQKLYFWPPTQKHSKNQSWSLTCSFICTHYMLLKYLMKHLAWHEFCYSCIKGSSWASGIRGNWGELKCKELVKFQK